MFANTQLMGIDGLPEGLTGPAGVSLAPRPSPIPVPYPNVALDAPGPSTQTSGASPSTAPSTSSAPDLGALWDAFSHYADGAFNPGAKAPAAGAQPRASTAAATPSPVTSGMPLTNGDNAGVATGVASGLVMGPRAAPLPIGAPVTNGNNTSVAAAMASSVSSSRPAAAAAGAGAAPTTGADEAKRKKLLPTP